MPTTSTREYVAKIGENPLMSHGNVSILFVIVTLGLITKIKSGIIAEITPTWSSSGRFLALFTGYYTGSHVPII